METKPIAYFNIPEEYEEYLNNENYLDLNGNINLTFVIPENKNGYFDFIKSKFDEGVPIVLELVNILPSLEHTDDGSIYEVGDIIISNVFDGGSIIDGKMEVIIITK